MFQAQASCRRTRSSYALTDSLPQSLTQMRTDWSWRTATGRGIAFDDKFSSHRSMGYRDRLPVPIPKSMFLTHLGHWIGPGREQRYRPRCPIHRCDHQSQPDSSGRTSTWFSTALQGPITRFSNPRRDCLLGRRDYRYTVFHRLEL